MNKGKLEVIRINEDVISTSGVCKHIASTGMHYYVIAVDVDGTKDSFITYQDQNADGILEKTWEYTSPGNYTALNGATHAGWWYTPDFANIYECDPNESHPISNK